MGASFVVIEAFRDGLELGPTLRRISTPRAPGMAGTTTTGPMFALTGSVSVLFAQMLLGLAALVSPVAAADLPISSPAKAPAPGASPAYDWSGWYVGANVGLIRGASSWSAAQPAAGQTLNGSFDLPYNFDFFAGTGSYVAGIQGGYNYVFPSRVMLGV
jgi:hypothetical protein